MSRIADMPDGYIGTVGQNEVEIVSTVEDPPKLRLGAPVGPNSRSLGCISGDARNGEGRVELTLMQFKQAEDGTKGGEFYLGLNRDDRSEDNSMVDVVTATVKDGFHFRVPVYAPNLTGSGAAGGRFYHEGGRFCTVYQADGHIVQYEIADKDGNPRPENEWSNFVVWTNWHGLVRPLPW